MPYMGQDTCWVSGSEDNEVRRYEKNKNQLRGLVTNANGLAIRCVAFDPKGKKLAVTSEYGVLRSYILIFKYLTSISTPLANSMPKSSTCKT